MKLSDVGQITVFGISLFFFTILQSHHADAQIRTGAVENSVSVSVEGEGNVKTDINQESQSLHKSTTTTSSNTNVTVEQNGNTQEFNSDGEDIHFVSEDGNVTVDIDNEGTDGTNETKEPKGTSGEKEATSEAETRHITWIEKDETGVLGEKDAVHAFNTGTFLKPVDFVMSVVTTIPSPVTPVDRLINLIESAVSFF